jgi:uncharacterized protein YjbI with pentapeptide repeats
VCDANLKGANLSSADLSGAQLFGVDLSNTRLIGVRVSRALYDEDTIWPEEFRPQAAGAIYIVYD